MRLHGTLFIAKNQKQPFTFGNKDFIHKSKCLIAEYSLYYEFQFKFIFTSKEHVSHAFVKMEIKKEHFSDTKTEEKS